jgi:uncharacterized protein (UPF0333 family)
MKKSLLFSILLVLTLAGCTEFEEPQLVQETEIVTQTRAGAQSFTTLPDPYALENMQAVYNFADENITRA